jgi:hypothetical protein
MEGTRILRLAVFPLILLLSVSFIACHPEPVMPQTARVLIIHPPAESTTTAESITVKTFVERFNLVNKTGQQNNLGEGHIVYYLDVTPPMEQGKSALTENGTYIISTDMSHTWSNIQPGTHTFWAQLVNNDNTPLEPPAAVRIYVTKR